MIKIVCELVKALHRRKTDSVVDARDVKTMPMRWKCEFNRFSESDNPFSLSVARPSTSTLECRGEKSFARCH